MALCLLPLNAKIQGKEKSVMVAGMGNGSIYFWEKVKVVKAVVGHSGSLSCICGRTDINSFISGDKSGKIIFWNEKFEKEREVNIPKSNSLSTMVVSLSHGKKKQLLIGTKGSNIYLLGNGENMDKAKLVMSGHAEGNITTLAIG